MKSCFGCRLAPLKVPASPQQITVFDLLFVIKRRGSYKKTKIVLLVRKGMKGIRTGIALLSSPDLRNEKLWCNCILMIRRFIYPDQITRFTDCPNGTILVGHHFLY